MSGPRTGAVGRQLRDFVVGAVLAIVVASCAFVAVRNHDLADRQLALATRAIDDLTAGREPLANAHAGLPYDVPLTMTLSGEVTPPTWELST